MRFQSIGAVLLLILWPAFVDSALAAQAIKPGEDVLVVAGDVGSYGGRLTASLRSDPKTLNPITVVDVPSRHLIALLGADLIHINLSTQRTEDALAKSWQVSA